jgi:hypothetical protein
MLSAGFTDVTVALSGPQDKPRLAAARAPLYPFPQNLSPTSQHFSSPSNVSSLENEASAKNRVFTRLVQVFSRALFQVVA